jgi:hypothetical protein
VACPTSLGQGMIKLSKFGSLALIILLLLSCSSKEQYEVAQAAINRFHELLATKNFDQIYAETSKNLKNNTTLDNFTKLLAAIDRKLGTFKAGENKSWSINYGTGGTLVTIGIQAQYEKGSAFETFSFVIEDGKAMLNGYNIQSQELLVN